MDKFAFISRHQPTTEQIELAAKCEIELIRIGDLDAFTVTPDDVRVAYSEVVSEGHGGDFDGVVVVHPAAAMRLAHEYPVGVFENGTRAAEGEKPSFYAKAFHVYGSCLI